jgi:hypothetical protein
MQRDFSKEVAIFKAANSLATEAPGNGWQWVAMGGRFMIHLQRNSQKQMKHVNTIEIAIEYM